MGAGFWWAAADIAILLPLRVDFDKVGVKVSEFYRSTLQSR